MGFADLVVRAAAVQLEVMGGFLCEGEAGFPAGTRTLVMLGPLQPGFWDVVLGSAEWGGADPVDRWSRRVVGQLACDLGGKALFPFGGPPWLPFYQWALRTGRVWESPVRLLVHERQGLMVSFRGALALKERLELPEVSVSPCEGCSRPCLAACPVGALSGTGYDLAACHSYLDGAGRESCMAGGCLARRACPVSMGHARVAEQSAYHMRQFHR